MNLEEFSCVLTFFMTLLMLERGFIHGDMHENNILLCVDDKLNINPVVIDFGRTSRLKFENKFDTENLAILMKKIEIVEDKKSKKEKLKDLKYDGYLLNSYLLHPYFRDIYNRAIKVIPPDKLINITASAQPPQQRATLGSTYEAPQQRVTPLSTYEAPKFMEEIIQPSVIIEQAEDAEIAKHIENLLKTELYVDAAIVSSMCCVPSFNHSVFYFFINSHLLRELSSYRSMYYCKSEDEDTQLTVWTSYDVLLKRLLEARNLKRQSLLFESNHSKSRRGVARQVMNTFVNAFEKLTRSGRHGMGRQSRSKKTKRIKRTRRTRRQK
jgi:hypothetical protein